jgi:uncharacterized membrane protein YfcA
VAAGARPRDLNLKLKAAGESPATTQAVVSTWFVANRCGKPLGLTLEHAIFLFLASIVGGALNAVAGGGSFVAFPTLLFTGVPPIPANATNALALWTGAAASGGAYRKRFDVPMRVLLPLLVTSVMGGIAGAVLLLRTPAHTFLRVLPWLMLAATLLFIFGKKLSGRRASSVGHDATTAAIVGASFFELVVAVYGGYFGGGLGIVNLAMLAAVGMTDIHAMNALKSILGVAINGVAALVFVVKGAIYWPQAIVMIAGALVGGYFGAHYAQKLPQVWIRGFVILVGTGMTVYFFVKAYGV